MRNKTNRTLYHIMLWLISILFFLPVFWIFLSAFKSKDDLLAMPPKWLFTPTLDNLVSMFAGNNFFKYLLNSFVISLTAVLIALLVSFLASYSFSRFKPKGTNFLMFLLLSMRMVPAAAVVVPVFLMYTSLGWKDTHMGIILFYAMFSIPFSVWILKGFIDGVSIRYDETALVNGGSRFHIIFRVVLPQVRPGLIAAFIFNMIFVWNEFLFNFIIGGKKVSTIPVALANGLYTSKGIDWTFIASLSLIYTLPLIIAIYFFQRYLLVGMTFGTVRGEV
ncbi:carbohydrate ABC transporter permease [Brevibacillus choshinensis]|uniref:carbohydrate ABC transporter permease n=1 Tax=Brevibacillus choshinensis TaxID=54911 RepID=UPI002E225BBA|nr:carbohydrate ABC transporter permease [Brevibacillus choshinensis]